MAHLIKNIVSVMIVMVKDLHMLTWLNLQDLIKDLEVYMMYQTLDLKQIDLH